MSNTGWGKTELERVESAIQRVKKRSDPVAKAMLPGLLKKRRALKSGPAVAAALAYKAKQNRTKKSKNKHRDMEKQRLYQARHNAKKRGEVPPPLAAAAA